MGTLLGGKWSYPATMFAEEDTTLVEMITAKDFALSSFKVAINRIQQVALDKASAKIPCPAEQLLLLQKGRDKERERRANLAND